MTIHIRGTEYEENLNNKMGLQFYDLSHPWGLGQPCWPYFEDVKIERLHSMAKSGVLTQKITTVMHSGVEWQRKVSHYLQPILSHRFLNNLA